MGWASGIASGWMSGIAGGREGLEGFGAGRAAVDTFRIAFLEIAGGGGHVQSRLPSKQRLQAGIARSHLTFLLIRYQYSVLFPNMRQMISEGD